DGSVTDSGCVVERASTLASVARDRNAKFLVESARVLGPQEGHGNLSSKRRYWIESHRCTTGDGARSGAMYRSLVWSLCCVLGSCRWAAALLPRSGRTAIEHYCSSGTGMASSRWVASRATRSRW